MLKHSVCHACKYLIWKNSDYYCPKLKKENIMKENIQQCKYFPDVIVNIEEEELNGKRRNDVYV